MPSLASTPWPPLVRIPLPSWWDEEPRRPVSTACQCYAPGECGGSCPGPSRCPIANDFDGDDYEEDGDE